MIVMVIMMMKKKKRKTRMRMMMMMVTANNNNNGNKDRGNANSVKNNKRHLKAYTDNVKRPWCRGRDFVTLGSVTVPVHDPSRYIRHGFISSVPAPPTPTLS